jgi:hypothetical protein
LRRGREDTYGRSNCGKNCDGDFQIHSVKDLTTGSAEEHRDFIDGSC